MCMYIYVHMYICMYICIHMKSLFAKTDNSAFFIFKNHVFFMLSCFYCVSYSILFFYFLHNQNNPTAV